MDQSSGLLSFPLKIFDFLDFFKGKQWVSSNEGPFQTEKAKVLKGSEAEFAQKMIGA